MRLYKAVCVESFVLFDLSPLDFCSEPAELIADCSALRGLLPFMAGRRSDEVEMSAGGSLAVLSVTIT